MNKVILMGRLTREPEVRYSQGAEPLAVARYTLAVNRRFKRKDEPEADFIPCVAFGKSGEFAEKYFRKGQLVAVTGRLQVRSWEDNEGKKRWTTEVVIEEQYFAEGKTAQSKPAAKESGQAPADGFYPSEPQAAAPEGWFAVQTSGDESVEDDDLPF